MSRFYEQYRDLFDPIPVSITTSEGFEAKYADLFQQPRAQSIKPSPPNVKPAPVAEPPGKPTLPFVPARDPDSPRVDTESPRQPTIALVYSQHHGRSRTLFNRKMEQLLGPDSGGRVTAETIHRLPFSIQHRLEAWRNLPQRRQRLRALLGL